MHINLKLTSNFVVVIIVNTIYDCYYYANFNVLFTPVYAKSVTTTVKSLTFCLTRAHWAFLCVFLHHCFICSNLHIFDETHLITNNTRLLVTYKGKDWVSARYY